MSLNGLFSNRVSGKNAQEWQKRTEAGTHSQSGLQMSKHPRRRSRTKRVFPFLMPQVKPPEITVLIRKGDVVMSDFESLVNSMTTSLDEEIADRAKEGFPVPHSLEEWRSWLTNEAFMKTYEGVKKNTAISFTRVAFLLKFLLPLVSENRELSPAIPAIPEFLFNPHANAFVSLSPSRINPLREERAFQEIIEPLEREFCFSQSVLERSDEGILGVHTVQEWTSFLINEGCLMMRNLSIPGTNETHQEIHRREGLFQLDMAIKVFRSVARLVDWGILPVGSILPFPLLEKSEYFPVVVQKENA